MVYAKLSGFWGLDGVTYSGWEPILLISWWFTYHDLIKSHENIGSSVSQESVAYNETKRNDWWFLWFSSENLRKQTINDYSWY